MDGTVGLELQRGTLTFGMAYSLERFDFQLERGLRRGEQVACLMLRVTRALRP